MDTRSNYFQGIPIRRVGIIRTPTPGADLVDLMEAALKEIQVHQPRPYSIHINKRAAAFLCRGAGMPFEHYYRKKSHLSSKIRAERLRVARQRMQNKERP